MLLIGYGNSVYQCDQKKSLTGNYSKIQLDLQRRPSLHCRSRHSLLDPPHPRCLVCIPLYPLPDGLGSAARPSPVCFHSPPRGQVI